MPALEPTTVIAVAFAVLAALARILPRGPASAFRSRLAAWALLAAGLSALASAAIPRAWSAAALAAAPLEDPRIPGSLALATAAMLSVLFGIPVLGATGAMGVSALAMPAVGAAIAAGAVAFMGLRGGMPLATVAVSGATLFALPRIVRPAGAWRQALLAAGTALIATGTALCFCGARAGPVAVAREAVADTLGYAVHYAGDRAVAAERVELELHVTSGRWGLEARPELSRAASAPAAHVPYGTLFSGPVLIVHGLERGTAQRHPVVWLTKGDSVAVGPASLRFLRFRIEDREGVHVYADLVATHGGMSTTVSPVVVASTRGEEPVPVVVEGVGSILIAGMDADHGRVALLIPGAAERPSPAAARFTLALRPGLELGWWGLALGLIAAVPLPRRKPA